MTPRPARVLVLAGLAVLAAVPLGALAPGELGRLFAEAWPAFAVFAALVVLAAWLVLRGDRRSGGLAAAVLVAPAFLFFFWAPWVALAPLLVAGAALLSRAAPSAPCAPRA